MQKPNEVMEKKLLKQFINDINYEVNHRPNVKPGQLDKKKWTGVILVLWGYQKNA